MSGQLDLFGPEMLDPYEPPPGFFGPELLDTGDVFTFQVACHVCDPPRIIAVIPVDGTWHEAECWGYIAHRTHEKEEHPPGP